MTDEDEELRTLLRAADPAQDLPPLRGEQRDRALREATAARRRSPLVLLAAAAAALVVGAGVVTGVVLATGPDRAGETAGGTAVGSATDAPAGPGSATGSATGEPGGTAEPGVRLSVPDQAGTARCMVPSAAVLDNQDVAFAGTVTAVDDDTVTLEVTRWFRGPGAAEVEVAAVEPELRRLLLAPEFVEGRDYLVSADDRTVSLCGFTGEDAPGLRRLYADAFG